MDDTQSAGAEARLPQAPLRRWPGVALCSLLALAVQAAQAQQPTQERLTAEPPAELTEQGGTEVATVTAVQIEGNITIPSSAILRHVTVQVGRGMSQNQIREDVRKLYATRWFFSVEPRYKFDEQHANGVIVIYQVVERPIVRKVEYLGNKHVSTKYLGNLTGIRVGSPFDITSNKESVRRIEEHYHEKGYTFASVELVKGGHGDDREVVFQINEGPKVQISDITFTGNTIASGARLKTQIRSKERLLWFFGGKFDPTTVPDDIAALKQYYHNLGFFDVKIEKRVSMSDDKAKVQIEFQIDEGLRYQVRSIEVVGNEVLQTSALKQEMKSRPGDYFNGRHVNEDVEDIKSQYSQMGRLFANVEAIPRFMDQPGMMDLILKIDEDQQYRIRRVNVHIEGDHPRTKEAAVANRLLTLPGAWANDRDIRISKRRLEGSRLFEAGPQNGPRVQITKVETDWATALDQFLPEPVTRAQNLPWEPPQTQSMPYQSNPSQPRSQLSQPVYTQPATYPQQNGPQQSYPQQQTYPQQSYPQSHPQQRVSPQQGQALPYSQQPAAPLQNPAVQQGVAPQSSFAPAPNPFSPQRETMQAAYFQPSSNPYAVHQAAAENVTPSQDILLTQNFNGNGLPRDQSTTPFYGSDPSGDPFDNALNTPPPGWVDLDYYVREARTGQLMFGVGVNSDAGVVGSFVLQESNFDILRPPTSFQDFLDGTAWRGGGQTFRLELVPGDQVSRYMVTWSDPYFLNTDYSLGVSGFYFNRFYPDWDEERTGGRINVGRQITTEVSVISELRLENVELSNPDAPVPPDVAAVLGDNVLSTLALGVAHDTRDAAFLPAEGHYFQVRYEQAFGDFDFGKATAQGRQYFTLYSRPDGSGRQILSLGAEVGVTSPDTPVYERFYAGGFQTFRGFAFRGVTPRVGGIGVGGRFQFLGSAEYMVPVTANDMVAVVAFSDFGTVDDDVTLDEFRATVGAGLRLTIPAMGPTPLAFDFAFPILSQDEDDERVFSFYVGTSF